MMMSGFQIILQRCKWLLPLDTTVKVAGEARCPQDASVCDFQ